MRSFTRVCVGVFYIPFIPCFLACLYTIAARYIGVEGCNIPEKPVMAFRRPKSLRGFLVRARLKPNSDDDNQNGECRPCGRKRCQCCKMITSAGTVKSSSGATVRLRQNTDCTKENVVYLISCSSCNRQHVGETKGPLNKRMNGHRDDWRHRRFEISPTAEHFYSADHDFLSHASVCCLEHNKEWSDSTRKLRESY